MSDLVNVLSAYADDTSPVAESVIRQFANEQNITLREDHVRFLARFGGKSKRPAIFARYGGDFNFDLLRSVYLDDYDDMAPPLGTTFFGSDFVGNCFCVDTASGKIFVYDDATRFGLVHESIDGFLLRCLVSTYSEKAFANKVSERDVAPEELEAFRLKNAKHKLSEGTFFKLAYDVTATPQILAEYYFVDHQLIALYPTSNSLLTLKGGVLDKLTA
ncbi:MAG: SMI1/KNR4 family protein [Gammaproteobacteria bacterium]